LRDFGWQPHIITIQDSSGKLTAKEQQLLDGIAVHQLTPLFDFTSTSGSPLSGSDKQSEPSGGNRSGSMMQPALDWIDKQFPADTWLPFFWLKYRGVIQIMESIQPGVLWSTGDPWSAHWLGRKLSKRFNVPWVADFRDPWTLGKVNLKNRSAFSSGMDKKMEAGVAAKASLMTFTSKTTENLYSRNYPTQANKMHTIYNAFDRELYNERGSQSQQEIFDDQNLNLLFFGKFRRLSPAKSFINILAELKARDAKVGGRIKMHSFGPLNESDKKHAMQKGVFDNFIRLQPIPAEEMLSVLPYADVMWLSTDADRKHIIPAKLWDYLAARRAILSIAPNPEIAEILDETGTGEQFPNEKRDALIALLQQCAAAKSKSEKLPIRFAPDEAAIKKYEAHHATQSLAKLFDALV
jgi:hypothetical protein